MQRHFSCSMPICTAHSNRRHLQLPEHAKPVPAMWALSRWPQMHEYFSLRMRAQMRSHPPHAQTAQSPCDAKSSSAARPRRLPAATAFVTSPSSLRQYMISMRTKVPRPPSQRTRTRGAAAPNSVPGGHRLRLRGPRRRAACSEVFSSRALLALAAVRVCNSSGLCAPPRPSARLARARPGRSYSARAPLPGRAVGLARLRSRRSEPSPPPPRPDSCRGAV